MLWKSRPLRANRDGGRRRNSLLTPRLSVNGHSVDQNQLDLSCDSSPTPSIGPLLFQSQQSTGPVQDDEQKSDSPAVLAAPEVNADLPEPIKHGRPGLLKFRHASDPQLSTTLAAAEVPPAAADPRKPFLLFAKNPPICAIRTANLPFSCCMSFFLRR